MMKCSSLVIGNSSSGIYEAPYLNTATVDVGSRQHGRAAPTSVIRCETNENAIIEAIHEGLKFEFRDVGMIYGHGEAASRIVESIEKHSQTEGLAIKSFIDRRVTDDPA
jgi:UDP-N-acetylglucosamine 2-epimerase (non-hydrolysing)/GDP/UDP-N,N'-diacetylbacillosamine 2-epimerase (hydrolysing)